MMKKQIILIGGFHEIIELCEIAEVAIVGILDNTITGSVRGHTVWGGDSMAKEIAQRYPGIPAVITPDEPRVRRKLAEYYKSNGFDFFKLVSPRANISPSAKIGAGCVVQGGVNISSEVEIGDFVKLNTSCNVMHDVRIGAFSTVSPNAVLLGKVTIGEGCYIGANSTVLPGRAIEDNVVVGAGSVVTHDVPRGTTVVGNPGRPLKK